MGKTALVTGGTRGIGKAISVYLKDRGFDVAANFGGNEEAAKAFENETDVRTYKFDVSDFDAVGAGLKAIETDLGPIEVVVNNAGITWDGPLHKMSKEQWDKVIDVDLNSAFNVTRQVWE
ncbi:MAG: SDR family NAD(P)-dependent oxidoreductase, partial [Pseudomonadota bacterium]